MLSASKYLLTNNEKFGMTSGTSYHLQKSDKTRKHVSPFEMKPAHSKQKLVPSHRDQQPKTNVREIINRLKTNFEME